MIENLYSSFINLPSRKDRLIHMQAQLKKVGIEAERIEGMLPHQYKGDKKKVEVMMQRTPGAVGCHFSQVAVMKKALELGKHAFVMEDDLIFCDDFQRRLGYIDRFVLTHPFDLIWLGGTVHINPPYWHTGKNLDLLGATKGIDAEPTDDPRMIRTYGAFSTYAYIVNVKSIEKILKMLDDIVHESMGIDWAFIKLQPQLLTYMFLPGCVKQMDNPSDIGKPLANGQKAFTHFSHFAKSTGPYWWQRRMEDFDIRTIKWQKL